MMFKRNAFYFALLMFFLFNHTVFGAFGWWDSTGDHRWDTPDNWNLGAVPTLEIDDGYVIINDVSRYSGVGVYIYPDVNAVANKLNLCAGASSPIGVLNVAGGTLTTYHNFNIAAAVGSTGVVNLSSGLIESVGGRVSVGSAGNGYVNITGGTFKSDVNFRISGRLGYASTVQIDGGVLETGDYLDISYVAASPGTLNVTGGTLKAHKHIRVGRIGGGTGVINLSGGLIESLGTSSVIVGLQGYGALNVTGGVLNTNWLTICQSAGSSGHVQLDGGIVDVNVLAINYNTGSASMDITGGTLTVTGDASSTIEELFESGHLTAYDGDGVLNILYGSSADKTIVTAYIPSDSVYARCSYPRNEVDQYVPVDANLEWISGSNAVSHMVYIGTSFEDVNEADMGSGEFKASLAFDSNSYDPVLAYDTTYYWRIDESDGNQIYKGDVWSFKTQQYYDANEEMLKWMDSMLAEDKYVAVHVDDYNSVEECWEPVTQVYQPFKSRVNKLWKQVYWRKDQLVGSFKGELFTYDNDNVRLHTETFPVFREEEWDCRIDKVRLFVEDSSGGGSMDWSQGRVIAPVDANTEWEYSSYVDTFEVLSWSNLNDQNAVIYQNNVDDYVTITVQSPWNNVYDGEADGWSADVEFTNFDEAILINQYMNGSTLRERFIFARKGDFYFGIVRWDTASKIGDQWHISRRAVGLKTKQDIDFGFDGFYERSRRDNWIAFYGDSNYNGFLDMSDISEFMINWQKQGGVTLGWDIDGDEIVNFQDYALMLLGYGN